VPVWIYVYLAVGSGLLGTGLTFVLLVVCQRLDVDVTRHLWLLGMPLLAALIVNVTLIELYRRRRHRRRS
jgi:hypothetical protein